MALKEKNNRRKKVLVVEDDDYLRHSLTDKLGRSFEVFEAADGQEAVEKIVDHRPDLILLDLLIPKLDGFKVLERLRQYPDGQIKKTHVVVLSNLWSNKDILQAQALQIDEYFVKANSKIEDVVAKVWQILS